MAIFVKYFSKMAISRCTYHKTTFDHWYPAYRAHHASSAVTSLATSPATDYV